MHIRTWNGDILQDLWSLRCFLLQSVIDFLLEAVALYGCFRHQVAQPAGNRCMQHNYFSCDAVAKWIASVSIYYFQMFWTSRSGWMRTSWIFVLPKILMVILLQVCCIADMQQREYEHLAWISSWETFSLQNAFSFNSESICCRERCLTKCLELTFREAGGRGQSPLRSFRLLWDSLVFWTLGLSSPMSCSILFLNLVFLWAQPQVLKLLMTNVCWHR